MKTAIVYYSLEGNTKFAAERMAAQMGADLIALEPLKAYPVKGFLKFYHGGKAAVFGEKPALKPYVFDETQYDQVIIGSPVWASKCAPPINTFMAKHKKWLKKLGGRHIGILLCQSGNGAQKVIEKYKDTLGVDDFAGKLVLIDPIKKREAKASQEAIIDDFCAKWMRD